VQAIADDEGVELTAERLWRAFSTEYLENGRYALISHDAVRDPGHEGESDVTVRLRDQGAEKTLQGHGTGPIDGLVDALKRDSGLDFDVANYREHAMGSGANATAVAYVELRLADGTTIYGVGIDKNIVVASLKAVLSGVNRALRRKA